MSNGAHNGLNQQLRPSRDGHMRRDTSELCAGRHSRGNGPHRDGNGSGPNSRNRLGGTKCVCQQQQRGNNNLPGDPEDGGRAALAASQLRNAAASRSKALGGKLINSAELHPSTPAALFRRTAFRRSTALICRKARPRARAFTKGAALPRSRATSRKLWSNRCMRPEDGVRGSSPSPLQLLTAR